MVESTSEPIWPWCKQHMKRCSTFSVIRQLQIKRGNALTTVKMAKPPNTKCLQDCRIIHGLSFVFGGSTQWHSPFERQFESFWQNYTRLTIQPSNCAPWYSPKWVKNLCPHKNLHTNIYSVFICSKTWKQPRYHSVGKWINFGISI